jgi:hypothetical protein
VAVFDCDIQNTQFVVGAEKTAEDDNSLNRQQFVGSELYCSTLASNPISAFSAVCRLTLPAAKARTSSSPLSVSFIREGIQPLFEWFNVALSLQLRGQSQRGFFVQR